MSEFDTKDYVIRVLKIKGHSLRDADTNDVFVSQWKYWKALIERHRLGDDPEKAEDLLTTFAFREVIGGASKVLETFAKHLGAQPKLGGSPDQSKSHVNDEDCPYCENMGYIYEIPVQVERHGATVRREYSFACTCRASERYPAMRKAEDWMLRFSQTRIENRMARLRQCGGVKRVDTKAVFAGKGI